MSIKFLSTKFGFTPATPKRAQNEEELYKSVENPQKLTLFRGGERNFMDKTILWTSGRFRLWGCGGHPRGLTTLLSETLVAMCIWISLLAFASECQCYLYILPRAPPASTRLCLVLSRDGLAESFAGFCNIV